MSDREKRIIADALFNYREEPRSGQLWGRDRATARAAAVLSALESAGYVVVPKEPTTAMFAAFTSKAFEQGVEWRPGAFEMFAADYRAMIAARDE